VIARLALLLLLRAPIQCASDPDPNRRLEDTPSEALWRLAERFEADGDEAARRIALEEIVERYPSSAEAERARVALGRSAPESTTSATTTTESTVAESTTDSIAEPPNGDAP
jgi:hypothetical protein